MAPSVLRRLYRARALASFLMSLPGILLVLWYGWSSFSRVASYRRATDSTGPIALETLHIALHDRLESDIRRILMPAPPDPSKLPTYRLRIARQAYRELLDSADLRGGRPYVNAKIEDDGRLLNADVRLRGTRHWHTLGAQKSLKVRLDKGELLEGHRAFNLINDPTSMVIGEQLIADLARESGVLTPVSKFARVKINSKDFGVYHYRTAADESLLRSSERMPGSIYNADLPGSASSDELWSKTQYWSKVASRTDSDADKADYGDLDRLLRHLRGTTRELDDFARNELDLQAFARLDVLDVAFGGDQRDHRDNHTFYFDPYRGRWEPISGTYRGFRHDPAFNLIDSPLLLRLKMLPEYLTLRNRSLYEFLIGKGRPSVVHARAKRLLRGLAADLRTDPYWDAYRQLPRVDGFHRRMVRPNTLSRLALVVESELVTYTHRHAQLRSELERNPLYVSLGEPARAPDAAGARLPFVTPLSLVIEGHAGVGLSELSASFREDCGDGELELTRAGVPLASRSRGGQLALARELPLHPSVELVARTDANPRRGRVRASVVPIAYELELHSSCPPEQLVARGRHLATRSRVKSRPAPAALLARLPERRLGADEAPRLEPGEVAPHPWTLERAEPRELSIGPGDVAFETTRVFPAHETVTVQPGTRLRLGPGASLVFLGRVNFDGERHNRIEVSRLDEAPFGGIALQGPASAGSRLAHVEVSGGTRPSWRSIPYPAMINVHDTREIVIDECRFGSNVGGGDTVHMAYVDELEMSDTHFSMLPDDALDLEYSSGTLRRLRIVAPGDDALDLMGSRVELSDSVILGAKGNGVSAGEESVVDVHSTLIASSSVGVLAKNAARVSLSGSVLFRNVIGVRTYQRTVRYAGDSEVTADVLFVAESLKKPVRRADRERERLDRGQVLLDLPRRGVLDHLLENVLELEDWQELPRWIGDQKEHAIR